VAVVLLTQFAECTGTDCNKVGLPKKVSVGTARKTSGSSIWTSAVCLRPPCLPLWVGEGERRNKSGQKVRLVCLLNIGSCPEFQENIRVVQETVTDLSEQLACHSRC
jgi:hypothetical protein